MATDPNKLSTAFANTPLANHGQKWSAFWEERFTPWDRGGPSLALLDIITTRPDLIPPPPPPPPPAPSHARQQQKKPTALVPGCGKGHDALLLANLGYDVLGLDFSPTAIAEAKENQKAVLAAAVAAAGNGNRKQNGDGAEPDVNAIRQPNGAEPGSVTWLSGDFFSDSWLETWPREGKTFDLIFDYTFLCALPPTARPQWSARMSSLLNPATGRLICLEFPSGKPLSQPGPPWGLNPSIYLALLTRPGQPLDFSSSTLAGDEADVVVVPPAPSEDGGEGTGLKRLALVKPARTHRAGMNEDGSVRDWVHVWSH
ncbi:S-adenosyl-L-methionine-dependent methyltransferase [Colletotrichum acutatum]|uniref:S-adenosyl-L-methionine-dependent methyltransferase n=1 Tax=Glomerella acutata TaxID=27357 RepID=A0AAD8XK12_GLOAC|nr:S-adenosyl-L-methionine-dependent methyltransferase [Colletotrichum acutatum]KAK1728715.1 S-adenosyl-L-methionine-dependent methyltransferase [Colletotrichum acutatum]